MFYGAYKYWGHASYVCLNQYPFSSNFRETGLLRYFLVYFGANNGIKLTNQPVIC